MINLPSHLQENEQLAVLEFVNRLSRLLGKDLCHLWLFGSKARGDFTDESDLDLLIVLRQLDPELRGIIQRMAARVSLNFDTLLNTHIKDKAYWDKIVQHEDTLWREIQRDGIPLHDQVIQPAAKPYQITSSQD